MPKRRSSRWARSCPKRSPPGRSSAPTSPASACSASPRPTCSTAAGPRRRPRAGRGGAEPSHVETLLSRARARRRPRHPCDAAPASLSWLGGVLGQRVAPLGVDRFGQTGSLADLYAAYRLDGAAITEAAAELLLHFGYKILP